MVVILQQNVGKKAESLVLPMETAVERGAEVVLVQEPLFLMAIGGAPAHLVYGHHKALAVPYYLSRCGPLPMWRLRR